MLTSGIPTMGDYCQVVQSGAFHEMERFSDEFLATYADGLAPYSEKWVGDPLHQWSRQWEYPYVFERVDARVSNAESRGARVLDAGSGVTFFPYYLQSRLPVGQICCVDRDDNLAPIFRDINSRSAARVDFTTAEMSCLPFDDEFFQIAYCISVLEHASNYPTIIEEFSRVLDTKGILVITFDISIDGDRDIPLRGAKDLLGELYNIFPESTRVPITVDNARDGTRILTTRAVAKHDRGLLPWRHPLISALAALRKGQLPGRLSYPDLTCFCAVFRK